MDILIIRSIPCFSKIVYVPATILLAFEKEYLGRCIVPFREITLLFSNYGQNRRVYCCQLIFIVNEKHNETSRHYSKTIETTIKGYN